MNSDAEHFESSTASERWPTGRLAVAQPRVVQWASEGYVMGASQDTREATPSSGNDEEDAGSYADSESQEPEGERLGGQRKRHRSTPAQLKVLNDKFEEDRFPSTTWRVETGNRIGLTARQIQIWFQNQYVRINAYSRDEALG